MERLYRTQIFELTMFTTRLKTHGKLASIGLVDEDLA